MSTNDTIITVARRVSEKSALDNCLLMVPHSKSEDALKIMMATDKGVHLKKHHKNKHIHIFLKTTIY